MDSSPRSGVSQLLSERPADHARCVSPTLEDWENHIRSNVLSQQLRHDDTIMDLTNNKQDENGFLVHDPSAVFESSHFQYEGRATDDGQTRVKGASATRPAYSLREILRTSRALHLSNHNLWPDDDKASTTTANTTNAFRLSDNIMTSHTLHHNESKLYYGGIRSLESQIQPRIYSSRRNRSRAIAIKRTPRDEKSQEIRESTATAEYDLSTWKMYNRIIDYRQKFPVNYHLEDTPSGSSIPMTNLQVNFGANSTKMNDSSRTVLSPYHVEDYPEYGEVFELDM